MTTVELRELLLSPEFKQDLVEMSSYLASIKQERPIVYCLAKHLWRKGGYKFQLEAKLKDLVVDGKRIEFKFWYDCDTEILQYELKKYGDLKEMWAEAGAKRMGWRAMAPIYKDICVNNADVFVWVLCSRDLSNVSPDDLTRICWSKGQCEWNKSHAYADSGYLAVIESFLKHLQTVRRFELLEEEIVTNGDFPSTYRFMILDFSTPA